MTDPLGLIAVVDDLTILTLVGVTTIVLHHYSNNPPALPRWEPKNPYEPSPYPKPKPDTDDSTPTVDDILNKDPLEDTQCETKEVRHEKPPQDQCSELYKRKNDPNSSFIQRMAAQIAFIALGCDQ